MIELLIQNLRRRAKETGNEYQAWLADKLETFPRENVRTGLYKCIEGLMELLDKDPEKMLASSDFLDGFANGAAMVSSQLFEQETEPQPELPN